MTRKPVWRRVKKDKNKERMSGRRRRSTRRKVYRNEGTGKGSLCEGGGNEERYIKRSTKELFMSLPTLVVVSRVCLATKRRRFNQERNLRTPRCVYCYFAFLVLYFRDYFPEDEEKDLIICSKRRWEMAWEGTGRDGSGGGNDEWAHQRGGTK